jgi:transcriptional regulator with XRE-family HTH domain
MWAKRLGRALRALRHRARLTQEQLGELAGVSRTVIMRIELGRISNIRAGTIEAAFEALDARIEIRAFWHGAALDRLIDEGHARLTGRVVDLLRGWGWDCQVEVSFAHYGDRGSIDVLAWHAPTRTLLVVEIKTELGSVEGLLRPLDVKIRLAPSIARDRFGWRAACVGAIVVLPDSPSVRRQVGRHAAVIDATLPARAREARRWLRSPIGHVRAVWFLSNAHGERITPNPSAIRRVRPLASLSAERGRAQPGRPTGPVAARRSA